MRDGGTRSSLRTPVRRTLPRRDFLKAAGLSAAAMALPVASLSARESSADDIRVAVIGIRGRGGDHIGGMLGNVVAVCDVDQEALEAWKNRFAAMDPPRKVESFSDFRRLLERQDIDAVSIATPNHLHSLIAIHAAQAGKDVYVEKPVSQTVWEGRQLANAARKYGRVIQCGTQSRSSLGLRQAVEFVRAGNLGPIQHVLGTCYKRRPSIGKLDRPLAIPSHIDYDLWCGPAAKVDLYRPNLHYDWHWDFNTGNGDMGNQGIHQMDIARWFLGADAVSKRVTSIGGRIGYEDAGNTPNTQVVLHEFDQAPILFETRGLPEKSGSEEMDHYRNSQVGVVVQCEQGHVLVPSYSEAIAYNTDGKEIHRWHADPEHYANFLSAVAARDASRLNAEVLQGHLSSALCHTGQISHRLGAETPVAEIAEAVDNIPLLADSVRRMRDHLRANGLDADRQMLTLGRSLTMDPATESFVGDPEADHHLRRQDREPFVVPAVAV